MADTIKVTLTPATVEVRPNIPADLIVAIHNTGPTVEQYAIEIDGLPSSWYTLPDDRVALFPGDHDETRIVILPSQEASMGAGSHSFTVTVTAHADPTERTSVTGTVRVAAATALDALLRPNRVNGRKARYRVLLHNKGNAPLDVDLDAYDGEEGCDIHFDPPMAHLQPGQKATARMLVRPLHTRLVGPAHPFDLHIAVRPSLGDERELQAQFIYTPRFRSWSPLTRLLSFVTTLAVLAVIAIVAIPTILRLVNPPQINAEANSRMGAVKLGATNPDAVMNAMGKGAAMTNHDSTVVQQQPGHDGATDARLRKGEVVSMGTTSSKFTMAGGVRVGSTVGDLKKAFGKSVTVVGGGALMNMNTGGAGGTPTNTATAGSTATSTATGGTGVAPTASATASNAGSMAANPLAGGAVMLVGKNTMDGQHPRTYFGLDKTGTRVVSIRMGIGPWVTPDHGGPTRVSAITQTATWTLDGAPYVVDSDLRIPAGVTVTIKPGVHVYFTGKKASLYVDGGTLRVMGTADAPVTFTALDDQMHGAYDTRTRPAPHPGDWGGLGVTASGGVLDLDHADVYYGAASSRPLKPEIYVDGSANPTVSIQNSEIAAAEGYGLDAMTAPPGTIIHGDTFASNPYALLINGGISMDNSNVFVARGAEANKHNAIWVRPHTTIAANGATVTWTQRGVPFMLQGEETVGPNGTLQIGPGVIIKGHDATSGLTVRDGTLIVAAQRTDSALMTSYKDDAQGGDSNADGAASSPQLGDWRGLTIAGTSRVAIHRLKIWWAGAGGQPSLSIEDHATGTINRVEVAEGGGDGISNSSDQPVEITNTSVHDNAGYGLNFAGGTPGARAMTRLAADNVARNGRGSLGIDDAPPPAAVPNASPTPPPPTPDTGNMTMATATPMTSTAQVHATPSPTTAASATATPAPTDTPTPTPTDTPTPVPSDTPTPTALVPGGTPTANVGNASALSAGDTPVANAGDAPVTNAGDTPVASTGDTPVANAGDTATPTPAPAATAIPR